MSSKIDLYFENLKSKRIFVAGLGISNKPLVEFLHINGVTNIVVGDNGGKRPEDVACVTKLCEDMKSKGMIKDFVIGANYLEPAKNSDYIFRSPGIRPDKEEFLEGVKNGAVLTSEMEEFMKLCPCKIYGITGSDGKTTTTTLTYKMLENEFAKDGVKVFVGGNIGKPLFPLINEMKEKDKVVLELSSFQLFNMGKSCDVSIITNLSPNHLDYHKNYQEYIDSKTNIFTHGGKKSVVVLNNDNNDTINLKDRVPGELRIFSRKIIPNNGAYCSKGRIYLAKNGKRTFLMNAKDIRIQGAHNIENYLAAISAVCDDVSKDVIVNLAKTFGGVEHRIEFVRELRGVKYYNSSIDSSPNRTIKALSVFPKKKVILIAGGKDKGIPYDEIGKPILNTVRVLILTGPTSEKIMDAVKKASCPSRNTEIVLADSLENAIKIASHKAVEGDYVLLSPASTSFDRFKNFEERGNLFKDLVNRLN